MLAGAMTAEDISLSVQTRAPRPDGNNQRVSNETGLELVKYGRKRPQTQPSAASNRPDEGLHARVVEEWQHAVLWQSRSVGHVIGNDQGREEKSSTPAWRKNHQTVSRRG